MAVILSAQATDKSVNAATPGLFAAAPTPRAMIELGVDGVREHIRTIGLFNSKAQNLVRASEMLEERHGGEVPRTREALEALPGVGRKTANVVLNTAFGEETIAVDTHIFRVSNRTGIAPGRNVREVEDGLLANVPAEYPAPRPPLAHPARALYLHRPPPALRRLPGGRSLPPHRSVTKMGSE